MIPLPLYLILSAALFIIGLVGVLTRRNIVIILMCIEMMLNAVLINLTAFSVNGGNLSGQIFAIFVISISAAEAAVGLSILLVYYRQHRSVKVDEMNLMKW
ncbi:MAG: NADH-quinone oxidoreductase subunit NuoK [Candidatus Schekmanbacteria bacterium]|nr:NADH-quinone oxidoreductase subunit NuoK [Candidatus Schekmanbacteria bacterium]